MKNIYELLAGTVDGVFAVDPQQRIVFWNDGARRILGFEAAAVRGRCCFEIMEGKDETGHAFCKRRCTAYQAAERKDPPPTVDVQVKTKVGSRKWINVTTLLMPSKWASLSLLVHLFRDVDQSLEVRYRLEQSLREANAAAESLAMPPFLEPLTPREVEILQLLTAGMSTKSIGRQLRIGMSTVRTHVQHILMKLGVHTRLEAVAAAFRHGVV